MQNYLDSCCCPFYGFQTATNFQPFCDSRSCWTKPFELHWLICSYKVGNHCRSCYRTFEMAIYNAPVSPVTSFPNPSDSYTWCLYSEKQRPRQLSKAFECYCYAFRTSCFQPWAYSQEMAACLSESEQGFDLCAVRRYCWSKQVFWSYQLFWCLEEQDSS